MTNSMPCLDHSDTFLNTKLMELLQLRLDCQPADADEFRFSIKEFYDLALLAIAPNTGVTDGDLPAYFWYFLVELHVQSKLAAHMKALCDDALGNFFASIDTSAPAAPVLILRPCA